MTDDNPGSVPELFFDGVTEVHIVEAVFRCTLISRQRLSSGRMQSVVVAHVAVPIAKLPEILQRSAVAMTRALLRDS